MCPAEEARDPGRWRLSQRPGPAWGLQARGRRRGPWSASRGRWEPLVSPLAGETLGGRVGAAAGPPGAPPEPPRRCRCAPRGPGDMDEAALLGALPGPAAELATDLFGAESAFASENVAPKGWAAAATPEEDALRVFPDAYLGPADPRAPGAAADSAGPAELPGGREGEELLGALPELAPLDDAALPAGPPPPPHAYSVHLLSSLLAPARGPAVLPLGAWAREGAAPPGARLIPVSSSWAVGTHPSLSPAEGSGDTDALPEGACVLCPQHPWSVGRTPSKRGASLWHPRRMSAGELRPGFLGPAWPDPAHSRQHKMETEEVS